MSGIPTRGILLAFLHSEMCLPKGPNTAEIRELGFYLGNHSSVVLCRWSLCWCGDPPVCHQEECRELPCSQQPLQPLEVVAPPRVEAVLRLP